tara:strand:+ start:741 stop:1967 length:1227 start_codon:yes stop_codon:yes gene_type:complete
MQCAIMQDAVDGIVAAVEDKIILKSDVILNMQLSGVPLSQNSYTLERMYNDFLNQMIDDKVLLVAAEQDTNIVIDNNMVDARLDEYMKNIITEVGSEEQLVQAFNKSIREIKYYYRTQIYDAMLREMYIYNYVGDLDVSRKEIELFYNTYQDSLPVLPAKYNFSIIEVPITASIEENERVKSIQKNLLEQINNGTSFDQLAKDFSEDSGTRLNGGDQGYYKKGTLFPEFEEVAFNLEINEVSNPIKTPIGYHLIKLIDKQKDQIHTKHILHLVNKSVDDEIRVFQDLTQISNQTENDPGMFDSLATVYSKTFNNNSGVYTNIDETQIPNYIKTILNKSNEYTLNKPGYNEDKSKCSIIYSYNIQQQSKLSIEKNWDELEAYTKNKKQTDLLIKLIDKLKHKTFIKYYN